MGVEDDGISRAVVCCISYYATRRSCLDPLWKLSTEIFPSLDAHARMGPSSNGAQAIELTLAEWRVCSLMRSQPSWTSPPDPAPWPLPTSFQMNTRPSYEHEARIEPNEGWAHATCQTGAVCLLSALVSRAGAHPFRTTGSPFASPLTTLKIRMVLSDDPVASLLP